MKNKQNKKSLLKRIWEKARREIKLRNTKYVSFERYFD